MSNLESRTLQDSASSTKLFFDRYGQTPLEFNSVDVDAAIGFFQSRGFVGDAALITGAELLRQSKVEGVPVWTFLDTLKEVDGIQLSELVSRILNNNRVSTSILGFRRSSEVPINIARNIIA